MELVGAEVVTSVTDSTAEGGGDTGMSMQEMLAAQVATDDVAIESSLLPEGVTVGAEVTGISVAVTTQAPTQSPTPRPTSAPTPAPTAAPTTFPTSADGTVRPTGAPTPAPSSAPTA